MPADCQSRQGLSHHQDVRRRSRILGLRTRGQRKIDDTLASTVRLNPS